MRGYARKRDDNEPDIILALRAVGATVHQLDGKGLADLLVGYQQRTYLIEVKNPNQAGQPGAKPGEKRTKGRGVRTAAQVKSFAAWTGSPIHEVINADEALVAIGALRAT
jgi:hypothetical protein